MAGILFKVSCYGLFPVKGIAFGPLRVAYGVEASLVTVQSQVGDNSKVNHS